MDDAKNEDINVDTNKVLSGPDLTTLEALRALATKGSRMLIQPIKLAQNMGNLKGCNALAMTLEILFPN